MMYGTLAHYYDALVKDEDASMAWVAFIEQHVKKGKVLELRLPLRKKAMRCMPVICQQR